MYEDNHILTKDELSQYQKIGYDLSNDKLYIIKFLFNDKWNEAVDPRPFRVKTSLIRKLAKDSVGMPYVVNPNNTVTHLRGSDEGQPNTAKGLLEIQAKYSIGLIKVPLVSATNNVYGIIEVWKEYEKMVLENKLPVATSPTLFVIKEDSDGIEEAQFLNINGVDKGGYPDVLSGTHGTCKGGIKECMTELSVLGASGYLMQSRADPLFLNTLQSLKRAMSAQDEQLSQTPVLSLETVAKDVEALKADILAIKQMLESMANKGSDEQATPIGAAGELKQKLVIPKELKDNEFVKTLLNEKKSSEDRLAQVERQMLEEKERKILENRKAHATSIVEKMILFKQVKLEDKTAKIDEFMNLKSEDGKLKDLEVLDNYLKSTIPTESQDEILGASGYSNSYTFSGDHVESQISNAQAMGYDQ